MQKFRCCVLFYTRNSLIKYLLMTKFAIFFLFAFSTQSFAKSYGQRNIDLRLEKVQLKKAFKAIENLGFFRFVYRDEILPKDQLVSIRVKDASLDEVLDKLLANTSLGYRKISDNLVVITEKASSSGAPAADLFAQRVAGRVVNNKGEPLVGVSVLEKGTN